MSKGFDLPKEVKGKNKYEMLQNAINTLTESSYVDDIKNDKINIMSKNIQIEYIDKKLEDLDLKAMKSMPIFQSNLEVEIQEALDYEIDKIPETIKDDVFKLEESLSKKHKVLNNEVSYLNDTVEFAKHYNNILLQQITMDKIKTLSPNIKDNYNKNEVILLVTDNLKIDASGSIEYTDMAYDKSINFEDGLNKIDVLVEALRQVSDNGVVINNDLYIKDCMYKILFNLAAVNINENSLDISEKSIHLIDFINKKDKYIKDNMKTCEISLKDIIIEIDKELELDLNLEKANEKELSNNLSKEKDDGLELDFF